MGEAVTESARRVNLVAVQARLEPTIYSSVAAFRQWVMQTTEEAVAGLPDAPTLVAFPELIGTPLLLLLDAPSGAAEAPTTLRALKKRLGQAWRPAARGFLTRPWRGLAAALLHYALPAYRTYHAAFSEAARSFGVTLVAGSIFAPPAEREAQRGLHLTGRRVYNQSVTFAASGTCLGLSQKVHFTPGLESRLGLARGHLAAQHPAVTSLGSVGVAICLDAFYDGVVAHFDGLGAQILVQPSANLAAWTRPWPADATLSEGEAWFRYGLRRQLQSRQNLVYGVNPMLVGHLWDLMAEGRSSLVVNSDYAVDTPSALEGWPGLLAVAESATAPEVVRATVPAPLTRSADALHAKR